MVVSPWILLNMKNISIKICSEMQNKFLYSISLSENRTVFEIMWENILEPDRPHMTIWRMRITFLVIKAKYKRTQNM
jgi:hypothetical protein